ncbi:MULTISPECIES: dTDP-4-dehydrorhamnose 3,5-epimerase [Leptospira]|uniref:dTDP-4-dehydrorhamnose 3,5-epimerase n=2 Tax=Leptospira interrogans serovar Pyrogenes TaxID=280500 RepID=M6KEN9_LEPIR|nr:MULTISPECIES: dTDP-4-dehydrorhamnose 3,5-epimerase [Leptospira]EMN32596.1 dTDP-4-dehydrorhamnose 3,5-epimerase [Leptospira interrogans serovar Pyrogenes str. L0374]EKO08573.1 dTDP-4-dehydrorhamnose 3,5-epimerase [Leptospira interrogans str. C10069]EKR17179.1 dTDP-4-dehydrorhamnose 3,5-epimerase [Leptospira interrogans serovar Pyrogenes str. 2006006960]EMN62242.1 dTDP-4-dehydrorhamnose 3,5-epimerase [Leptospira interrogans serovar Pyrogenes str. R168]MCL8309155.1 dTDP-4-dehydrorhamnose 3,5-e
MKFEKTSIEGLLVLYPDVYEDERGFFLETYETERYKEIGIEDGFVQDNHSHSVKNVIRGMHFTKKRPQSQILTVMRGTIFDVVVDIRKNSSTFGKWFGLELSDDKIRQVYMSPGLAHGFCTLSDSVDLHYKVSEKYDPNDDAGLNYADPTVKISWPIQNPIVSKKDQNLPFLKDII